MNKIVTSGIIAVIFSACGGGGSSVPSNTGYFEDSAVIGAEYTTSTGHSGLTSDNGEFRYKSGDTVTFKIGNIILGSKKLKTNNEYVTPEDLDGVDNTNLALILQFLQSLDADNNTNNGIQISQEHREELKNIDHLELHNTHLTEAELLTYLDNAHKTKDHIKKDELHLKISTEEAEKHFKKTKQDIEQKKLKHDKDKNKDKDKQEKNKQEKNKNQGNSDKDHKQR